MNNDNRKIVKYDPNTGAPIYEEVPVQVQPEQVSTPEPSVQPEQVVTSEPSVQPEQAVDNSRFQPHQNNGFEQPVMNNNYQQPVQQPVMNNNYQQPVQQPMMNNNYQQPVQQPMMNNNYQQPMMNQYQQPMMNQYQPQPNLNQTSYQPSYEKKKSNKGLIIGIIIGIIVLIAVVVIGYFVFFNGNDDKKTDSKTESKPTTTINDYDDDNPTPTPEPDPEPEKPTTTPTTSDYISFGHLKYKKISGYSYSIDDDMLKITFGTTGKVNVFETTLSNVQQIATSEDDFRDYLINDFGVDSVDEFYSFERSDYSYIACFVEYSDNTYLYFLSTSPNPSYYIEGVMVNPDDKDAEGVIEVLDNILSSVEK